MGEDVAFELTSIFGAAVYHHSIATDKSQGRDVGQMLEAAMKGGIDERSVAKGDTSQGVSEAFNEFGKAALVVFTRDAWATASQRRRAIHEETEG